MSSAHALRKWKAMVQALMGDRPVPGDASELDRLWLDLTPADRELAAAWLARMRT